MNDEWKLERSATCCKSGICLVLAEAETFTSSVSYVLTTDFFATYVL